MTDETKQAEPQAEAADVAATEEPLTETAPEPTTPAAMTDGEAAAEPTPDEAAPAATSAEEPAAESVAETAPEPEPARALPPHPRFEPVVELLRRAGPRKMRRHDEQSDVPHVLGEEVGDHARHSRHLAVRSIESTFRSSANRRNRA